MGRTAQKIRIRVAGVVLRDDKILLVKHRKKENEYWLLPGGGVDVGESLANALAREFWEELRVQIRVGNVLCINDSIAPDASRHILNAYFYAEIKEGEPILGEDPRVVDVAWHSIGDLENIALFPAIAKELVSLLRARAAGASYLGTFWKD